MKYRFLIILASCLMVMSCNEDYPATFEGDAYLVFPMDDLGYSVYVQQHFNNFYYYGQDGVDRDTIYVPLNAFGSIPKEEIAVRLETFNSDTLSFPERIDSATENAISGVHYVPFESEEMINLLKYKANVMEDSIPIILLRDESLKETTFRLTFRLAEMENAKAADKDENRVVIYIADKISRPSNWDFWYFGTYGDVKLDFMINHSDLRWTEDDMEMVLNDSFLLAYYVYKFKEDLKKYNEELGADGPLREADGTVVTFDRTY